MRATAGGKSKRKRVKPAIEWKLRLYVAGNTDKSTRALQNLHDVCEKHLEGLYEIEVIDLLRHPKLARGDQIVAIPTLVRRQPSPVKKMIGDLSDIPRLLASLDLRPDTEGM